MDRRREEPGARGGAKTASFKTSPPPTHHTQPDPKAAVVGAVGGVAALAEIKLLSASQTAAQPVGRLVCFSDWRSGVVVGLSINGAPTTCGTGDVETPVNLGAQDYVSDVDVALVKGTKLVGRLTFTIKNAAGQPTRYVSCGRVPDSALGKALAKTTAGVRGKGATGRLSAIKAACLPTGPLTVPPFYVPPILEETATPGDPRIGVIDAVDEPPLDTPLDPGTFIFEYTPRSCKAYVYCTAGGAVTTYDAGCDPTVAGNDMFFVDAVTGVALSTVDCPPPGVPIEEIIIEVPPPQNYTCWATNTCTPVPPPAPPSDPPPDPIVVPVNTPIPVPPPPTPTPTPAPPVGNNTVPGQRVVVEGGTCTYNGVTSSCVPTGSSCPVGTLPVAGDRNGKCPTGQCCAPNTALCSCNNSANKADNCGFYAAQDQVRCERGWIDVG